MKRTLLLLLMATATLTAIAQTDLYNRYSSRQGVKVASVSGFAIDSTTRVDVTLLEAETDAGWQWLKDEFYIGDLSPQQEAALAEGHDAVLFARRSRSNPRDNAPVHADETLDVRSSCYICISYLDRTVYIFCADSDEEYEAVASLLVKKIMRTSR